MTSPEARRLKGFKGRISDGSEAQRGACHSRDVIEAT